MANEAPSPPSRRAGGLKALRRGIRDSFVVKVLSFAVSLVPRFSLETVQRRAGALGALLARVPSKRRDRVRKHLAMAFPEMEESRREEILRGSYRSMAQLLVEALWLPAWENEKDDSRVRIETPENWERTLALAAEQGKGLIIYTAHLGTVEVLGRWFTKHLGMPVMAVAAKPKMQGLEEMTRQQREAGGYKVVWRGDAGMATMRHLRAGGALVMLVDHNLRGPGVAVPFFGHDAHTLLAPARLALQSGAVANTMFCLREGTGRLFVSAGEPMVLDSAPRDKEQRLVREAQLALEYTRRIEEQVRKYPEQYLWMHRRWEKRSDTLPFPS